MTVYTAGRKPVDEVDATKVSIAVKGSLMQMQGEGKDGLDVAIGALSALRSFVLWNVGPEAVKEELKTLADILVNGEIG